MGVVDAALDRYQEMAQDIQEVLYSAGQIQRRVESLGREISADYAGRDLVLVGVLKGVFVFLADLVRQINLPLDVDFMAISSYSAQKPGENGAVRIVKDLEQSIAGRHVLFVEDVIDTGLTLDYVLRNLRARRPASLEVCALFNKPSHRLIETPLKYKGFDLPDRFVVGYGLDHRGRYRNLPFVGLLQPHIFLDLSQP